MILTQGLTLQEAAQRITVPRGTLAGWVAARVVGGRWAPLGRVLWQSWGWKNKQLRKELAQMRMERDIVKKAAAYFARESLQGTRL
ncbi:hypothetical protein [Acidithiobacillus ferrivorans]|uniref:Transposase n=1 Tax=Acidithiobacillus ferrivorans TaxID=160808 RepID=A0A7T4WEQ5_9PROT|nr:hypothetical protein [Acidithiobacillus ferrivorans]QQD73264.1 hypothetical protein H2515_02785 [Acidithiobacillus ferrivorans]